MDIEKFQHIAKLLRYYSLLCTTKAGSGHPTSSLSAADIMAVLYFGFFKYDFDNPKNRYNDRFILSKGHATPLLYSLYKLAGRISEEELLTYRTLTSPLQGHPTPQTPYVDVATGSLGMGLSYGLGMAMGMIAPSLDPSALPKTYVLLGDGEMAEGQVWEALEIASFYKVHNLVGIIDVNGLGQTGPTMLQHDTEAYQKRISAFGWETKVIDGHDVKQIYQAFDEAQKTTDKPTMIIANTVKGKGISFLENKENWHGKALSEEEFAKAFQELNIFDWDKELAFEIAKPTQDETIKPQFAFDTSGAIPSLAAKLITDKKPIATRKAYGMALDTLAEKIPDLRAIDAEVANSTYTNLVQKDEPGQFTNMYISEQNMICVATGLSKMGKKVIASTFAAFLTRAFDQLRMSSYSEADINIVGSHCGVSIGEDGPSQMGLEDIAMMRVVQGTTILYPSDAVSAVKLTEKMLQTPGICYLRTTREPTPSIYPETEEFLVGKSKTLRSSDKDVCTIVTAGVTLHEALQAHEHLKNEGILIRIIDCYSIKPIDVETLIKAAAESQNRVITIEDHYFQGGLGDAVLNVFAPNSPVMVSKMAINQMPHSGKPHELLEFYGLDSKAIVEKVKNLIPNSILNR